MLLDIEGAGDINEVVGSAQPSRGNVYLAGVCLAEGETCAGGSSAGFCGV